MKKLFFVAFAFLAGCATVEGYKDTLQTWMGHSDSELIQAWGQPTSSYTSPDGNTVLDYHRERTVVIPGYTYNQAVTTNNTGTYTGDVNATYMGHSTTYVPTTTPSQTVNKFCDTRFTVSNHTLVAYSFNGNDCVGFSPKKVDTQANNSQSEEFNRKKAEFQTAMKEFDARVISICNKPEYSAFFLKTTCNPKDITFEQLADGTKITPEQKAILLKYRTEVESVAKEQRDYIRKVSSGNLDIQWVDYLDSMQPEIQKFNLAFYKGELTWGEYNQRRKDSSERVLKEYRRIFAPAH